MHISGALLLIGCGKMGAALLQGWLDRGLRPEQAFILDPSVADPAARPLQAFARAGVGVVGKMEDLPQDKDFSFIVLAVKPQVADAALPSLQVFVRPQTVFLSVIAGKPTGYFKSMLGQEAIVVRSMPNTPAAVGRGITVLYNSGSATERQKQDSQNLMSAVGETAWLDDENLMDAVTGLSGSGPAYVFFMVEAMAKAGEAAGLPRDLAEKLAKVTVSGAGELLHLSGEDPATLRRNVTSPKGTTEQGLSVLMRDDQGLEDLMRETVAAATRRSKELSKD